MQTQVPSAQQLSYGQLPYNSSATNMTDPSRPQHSAYTTGQHGNPAHTNGVDMNPYTQPYAAGYASQPQHHPQTQHSQSQRPYLANQLPPLGIDPTAASTSMPPNSQYMSAPPPPMSLPAASQAMGQSLQALPSASRAPASNPPQEKKMFSTREREGLRYSLEVVQQPQRARMCGFGDKDRRPITPPPCVRLVIVDEETGREIDLSEVPGDPSFFILQVDLWSDKADRETNVVRASSNSPAVSISSATTTSYPPPTEHRPLPPEGQQLMYLNADGQPMYSAHMAYPMSVVRPPFAPSQYAAGLYYSTMPGQTMGYMAQTPSSNAMYTRNLIGSLTVNASRLDDDAGKPGLWFVLQDLSVRTEGDFRLRMSFIDISNSHGAPGVNRGRAEVLAWTFSDVFTVFSAKKFPGVIESTPLSKRFASQGIKIPIRKDNNKDDRDGSPPLESA